MTDQAAIASTIHAFYEGLSGPAGTERDWNSIRSLFIPGAIIVVGTASANPTTPATISTVEQYVERLKSGFGQRDFYEKGTISRIDIFGNIASIVSTYEARRSLAEKLPFKQGVNYIHLLRTGERWRITSMIWRDESSDLL